MSLLNRLPRAESLRRRIKPAAPGHMDSMRPPVRGRRDRATILIIVLWIALGLVSLALYFGQTARWSIQASQNNLAGQQAQQAIEGARRYIMYVLDNVATAGQMPSVDNDDYHAEEVEVDDAKFWIVGRDPNSDQTPLKPVWGLVDEASKININTATQEMLEALPNMTSELAAAIIDWRDPDSDITQGGAESQDYESLATPYAAKNGPFESVEELRLVKGMTTQILWGEDTNGNGVLDANENDATASYPDDDADGKLILGLAEYVTAWTREPNTQSDGSPRINIHSRTAQQELRQLLERNLGSGRANEIIQRIGNRLPTIGSALELFMQSGMTADEFAKIEDAITTDDGPYRVGLINIRTAPSAVLLCLPGMDQSKVDAVIAQRRKSDDTALKSIAWIASAIELETARQIGPHITARTYQCSADIAAEGANGRGLRRTFMVFDRSDKTRLIYRMDRGRMGWPLGDSARDDSQSSTSSPGTDNRTTQE